MNTLSEDKKPKQKKHKNWRKLLKKSELIHLMKLGVTDLKGVSMRVYANDIYRVLYGVEPCWTCRIIEEKLKKGGVL